MRDYKVTFIGESGTLRYEVSKTKRGLEGFIRKIKMEAYYGESVEVEIEELK